MKKTFLLLLAVGFIQLSLLAQVNEAARSHFKTDITYLASDALEGRLAGSPGEKMSADYIAAEMQKAGLTPVNGNTFQTFDIVKLRLATTKCSFRMFIGNEDGDFSHSFILNEEFYPINESCNNDSAEGEMVFVDYGIESEEFKIHDYKGRVDLKGKIFIISLGFPGEDTMPHGPLSAVSDIATKVKNAIEYGAAGIIFIPGSGRSEIPKGQLERNANPSSIPVFYFRKQLPPIMNMRAKLISVIASPASPAYNVMGFRNNHKKRTVIICAHHDHLGYNEYGNSTYTGPQAIHNGADDNASGVAAMLELARELKGRKYRKNNYLFIAFSGEELGLLGSKYFVQNLPIDKEKINYVINIDMLGRMDSSKRALIINGTGTSPQWEKSLSKIKTDTNLVHIVTSESGLGPSDHASFYLEGIPVLHFFTGQHMDYHKPSDDEEKINYAGMVQSFDVIEQTIAATNRAKKLKFTKTKDIQPSKRSFKVSLGIMPDYSYTGKGLHVDAVTDGKPGALAGLLRGDVITKMGEIAIGNVQDYMGALSKFEKGQTIAVTVLREGTEKVLNVTF